MSQSINMRPRLVEANVVLGGWFRWIGMSCSGTGKTGHAAWEIHSSAREVHSTARHGGAAKFRGHFIDKRHYLGIVLIFQNIHRIRGDVPEGLSYFRVLQTRSWEWSSHASSRKICKNCIIITDNPIYLIRKYFTT